jgi:hypothetical protein
MCADRRVESSDAGRRRDGVVVSCSSRTRTAQGRVVVRQLPGRVVRERCGRLRDGVVVRSTSEAQGLAFRIPSRVADIKFGGVIFFPFPPSVHGLSIARHFSLGDAEVAVHEEKA